MVWGFGMVWYGIGIGGGIVFEGCWIFGIERWRCSQLYMVFRETKGETKIKNAMPYAYRTNLRESRIELQLPVTSCGAHDMCGGI